MDSIFTSFRIELILDWLIIGFISYKTLSILRGTRALNILLGFIVLSLVYFISVKIQLPYSQKILSYFFDNLILIIIILFQEDLRRVLANVGRKTTFFTSKEMTQKEVSKNIAKVSAQLAKENIGALIVIEKQDKLADVISSGSRLNSLVKPEFIYPIFLPNSPIHDGAIIISQGTIAAAGCLLPLSKDAQLNKKFGTRHKAAIGLISRKQSS